MKTNAEPYVQKVSAKSIELYQASKDVVLPHVVKAHKIADPYFQVHLRSCRFKNSQLYMPGGSLIMIG